MGWEPRRGRLYYYQKRRVDGRVRSIYAQGGIIGQWSDGKDEIERNRREEERAAQRAARDADAEIDRQLRATESALDAITASILLAAGFHRHKGQWRKQRRGKAANGEGARQMPRRHPAGCSPDETVQTN